MVNDLEIVNISGFRGPENKKASELLRTEALH
jgi:hypothetical protein